MALRRPLIGYFALALFGAAILPVEIVLVTDTLGGSEAADATVRALWGFGAILGSALLGLIRRAPTTVLITGSVVIVAISYLGIGTASSVELVCLFSLLGGIANGVEAFAVITAIQEQTTDDYQARVGGLAEAVGRAATRLGFLIAGATATLTSTRAVYVLAGSGCSYSPPRSPSRHRGHRKPGNHRPT